MSLFPGIESVYWWEGKVHFYSFFGIGWFQALAVHLALHSHYTPLGQWAFCLFPYVKRYLVISGYLFAGANWCWRTAHHKDKGVSSWCVDRTRESQPWVWVSSFLSINFHLFVSIYWQVVNLKFLSSWSEIHYLISQCSVPEVIALPIKGGNLKYLEWLKNSTRES